jgi:GDP-4-dehydro-6-deoxy-D-mannose reductase
MRVLVTGARGFVGGRLVPRLVAAGHSVEAAGREVDVADARAVECWIAREGADALVHLAGLAFVPDSLAAPETTFRVNYLGARNVLEAARRHAPGARVLLVSTGHVYGTSSLSGPAFDECAPLRPESPYARTKAAADLLARDYGDRGVDVVRVRPFNHTGRGRPAHYVEANLARQVARIECGLAPSRIAVGNMDAVRDFLNVEDVVDAYVLLLDRRVPAAAYNVASGVPRTAREVLDGLLELAGLGRAECGGGVELAVEAERWRPTDRAVGDATRLRQATGWKPSVAFEDTLRELLADARATVSAA